MADKMCSRLIFILLLYMAGCSDSAMKNETKDKRKSCRLSCEHKSSMILPEHAFDRIYPTTIKYCMVQPSSASQNNTCLIPLDKKLNPMLQEICRSQENVLALDCGQYEQMEIDFTKPSSSMHGCFFEHLLILNCNAHIESFDIFFKDQGLLQKKYNWTFPPIYLGLHNWMPPDVDIRTTGRQRVVTGLRKLSISQDNALLPYIPHKVYSTTWRHLNIVEIKNVSSVYVDSLLESMPDITDRLVITSSHLQHPPSSCTPNTRHTCKELILNNNWIKAIPSHQFKGNIEVLDLSSNLIEDIEENAFELVRGMVKLDLSNNKIQYITKHMLNGLDSLELLKLDYNYLTTISANLQAYIQTVPNWVDLSNNQINSFIECQCPSMRHRIARLNMKNNYLTKLPSWLFSTRTLVSVDLSGNHLSLDSFASHVTSVVKFLPFDPAASFPLYRNFDLSDNNVSSLNKETFIKHIDVHVDHDYVFQSFLSLYNFDLAGNPIICDCHMYTMHLFLRRALGSSSKDKTDLVTLSKGNLRNWRCDGPPKLRGISVVDVLDSDFMCEKNLTGCPEKCTCLLRIHSKTVFVNCSARELKSFPRYVPLGTDTLDLSDNEIESIADVKELDYITSLKSLILTSNKINVVDEQFVTPLLSLQVLDLNDIGITYLPETFKKFKATDISLSGNTFVCDCESKWMARWMFAYHKRIKDVEGLICSSGKPHGKPIINADPDDFVCERYLAKPFAIFFGSLVAVFVLIGLPVYKFRGEIKVFLYVRFRWRPFHNDIDVNIQDKLYDAFVAYCTDDVWWVNSTLIPALETPEHQFRMCVNERDFFPGTSIIDNIINSIDYSRRTILILSKNFLKSEWCKFEFQMAHLKVLKQKSCYLIVVLLDDFDLKDDNITREMQLYLRAHTYVRASDVWFWSKMLYAMPSKPLLKIRGQPFPSEGFKALYPFPDIAKPGSATYISNCDTSDNTAEEALLAEM